jgi:HD-GYP domain-containing protein (c-di-GMP phosphodiesterase class II)
MQTSARSIHRRLLARITAVGLLLAVVAGALSYLYQRGQVAQWIGTQTAMGAELLKDRVDLLLGTSGRPWQTVAQEALDDLTHRAPLTTLGRFIVVRVTDDKGREAGQLVRDPQVAGLAALPPLPARLPTLPGAQIGQPLRNFAHPLVPVLISVAGQDGRIMAHVQGLFEVSAQTVARLERATVLSALIVAGAVLATALVIYPIVRGLTGGLTRLSAQLLEANLQSIRLLGSAIAKRDSDTDAHNYRVTVYAVHLAERIGLSATDIRSLIKGAFLHDVGKIGIPDRILLKPGRLDEQESAEMKRHVAYGLDIIAQSAWLQEAQCVVGSHHEKYDGSGYDRGLKANEIPIGARIFAIADVFDALTSKRPYKQPLPLAQSLQMLRDGAGRHFDPAILGAFEALAEPLYQRFAGHDEAARQELDRIVSRYFGEDLGLILEELRP